MTTNTPHIGHLIGGQMIPDGDVRDAHDPGRLDYVGREFGNAGLSEYAEEHGIRRLK